MNDQIYQAVQKRIEELTKVYYPDCGLYPKGAEELTTLTFDIASANGGDPVKIVTDIMEITYKLQKGE